VSFALAHAQALAHATAEAPDVDALTEHYRADAGPEARKRHTLACATDEARSLRWRGEPLEIGRCDSCLPALLSLGALPAAPHDDLVLRRTIRRIGLLDRTSLFDEDQELQDRIEAILGRLAARLPSPRGPPRQESWITWQRPELLLLLARSSDASGEMAASLLWPPGGDGPLRRQTRSELSRSDRSGTRSPASPFGAKRSRRC
jgi:hypothetical protein